MTALEIQRFYFERACEFVRDLKSDIDRGAPGHRDLGAGSERTRAAGSVLARRPRRLGHQAISARDLRRPSRSGAPQDDRSPLPRARRRAMPRGSSEADSAGASCARRRSSARLDARPKALRPSPGAGSSAAGSPAFHPSASRGNQLASADVFRGEWCVSRPREKTSEAQSNAGKQLRSGIPHHDGGGESRAVLRRDRGRHAAGTRALGSGSETGPRSAPSGPVESHDPARRERRAVDSLRSLRRPDDGDARSPSPSRTATSDRGTTAEIREKYRPGHADFTFDAKYGFRDYRGGGRSSARETAVRVAAGAIAKKLLRVRYGTTIVGYVKQVGAVSADVPDPASVTLEEVEANIVRCPDAGAANRMIELIERVRREGDSVGGIAEIVATGVPAGWGEPVFDKLKADLGKGDVEPPRGHGRRVRRRVRGRDDEREAKRTTRSR